MKRKFYCALNCICILVFFILNNSYAFSETGEGLKKKQKIFIKKLLSEEDYFQCISETERLFGYWNLNNNEIKNYNYLINACYYLGEQYKTSVFRLTHPERTRDFRTKLLLSRSYFKLNLFDESREILMSVEKEPLSLTQKYDVLLWKIDVHLYLHDYEAAIAEVKDSAPFPGIKSDAKALISDLMKYRDISQRSPVVSGFFSAVVPGAGQVFSERYMDGFISLAGVLATAAASVFFYQRNEKGLCITFGVFSGLFYGGNIYSAWNAAEIRNRKLEDNFRDNFRKKHLREYKPMDYIDRKELFD